MSAFERIAVDGIEIAYVDRRVDRGVDPGVERDAAAASAADRLPLVFVHGFTGHRDDFAGVLPVLARERRCVVPDLRGHGDSSHCADPRDYDFSSLVADLGGFLDALEIGECHLLGHSMGGMVALRFVLAHPERVASLILMNTSAEAPEGLSRDGIEAASGLARARGMSELQRRVEAQSRREEGESELAGGGADEAYWIHHRRRYGAMDPEAYGALGLAMLDQESQVARLGEIRCPVLVLVGAADGAFVAAADALAKGIPGSRHAVIPRAAHHPHRDNPSAWLAAVEAHLAGQG